MWINYETTQLDSVLKDIARLKKSEKLLHDLLNYYDEASGEFIFPDAKAWRHPRDKFRERIEEYAEERNNE